MSLREANSLRDLLKVREANRARLSQRPGYLGSAVGFKYSETKRALQERDTPGDSRFVPAIILFVDRKLPTVDPSDLLPAQLGTEGVFCATDVVVGRPTQAGYNPTPLDSENGRLRQWLHEEGRGVFGGMPLSSHVGLGAAACMVYLRRDPTITGILTADHVAGLPGTVIERPVPRSTRLGVTETGVREVAAKRHLKGVDWEDAVFRLDAAFIRLAPGIASQAGIVGLQCQGEPSPLDLDTFDLLGVTVESVGPIRAWQRGQVVGFGYEWNLGSHRELTDWLIVGADGGIFAEPGDSGKLVVRADNQAPVALLWGGRPLRHSGSGHQESWCYASHLHSVLENLGVSLIPSNNDTPQRPPPKNLPPAMNPTDSSLPTSGLASPDSLNLRYLGAMNDVEVHYDGRLVIHSIKGENGAVRYLVSLFGGPCVLHTQRAQRVTVAAGRVVKQAEGDSAPTDHKDNARFELAASSQCWFNAVEGFCQLLLTPVPDPGFGGRDKERPILQ